MAGIGSVSGSGYPPQKAGGNNSTGELLKAMVEMKKMEAAEKSGGASGKKASGGGLGQLVGATGGDAKGGGNILGTVVGLAAKFFTGGIL
ncbi:MAG TPA: hypothetical protein V6C52_01745 [Coleofasciculaceae cyanobacterium]